VIERTLVLVKPDGVMRSVIGEVISRLEKKGLKPVGIKLMAVDRDLAQKHYAEHRGKPFFESLVDYITSGPIISMVWEGDEAIATVRNLTGATDPSKAAPGTIRGDLALNISFNLVHASDSPDSAKREIALFFSSGEMIEYSRCTDQWI
jgi:nucleoside-diphosphate kinase